MLCHVAQTYGSEVSEGERSALGHQVDTKETETTDNFSRLTLAPHLRPRPVGAPGCKKSGASGQSADAPWSCPESFSAAHTTRWRQSPVFLPQTSQSPIFQAQSGQGPSTGCCAPRPLLSQVILSESSAGGEVFFFETWMQTCMPEEGKILNPDHPCFRPDSTKVESLVALLNNSSEIKLVSVAGRPLPGWWGGQVWTPSLSPLHVPHPCPTPV